MKEILIILALQLVYVPIVTIRTMMLVKGKTRLASMLGTIDVFIYVTALGVILKSPSFAGIVTYALGFGIGILVGSYIERKLAIGEQLVQIHVSTDPDNLKRVLYHDGFGLTVYEGIGINGTVYRMDVLAPRHRVKELKERVKQLEPKAFLIVLEPADYTGGFLREDEGRIL